jgi:hypothetical protein
MDDHHFDNINNWEKREKKSVELTGALQFSIQIGKISIGLLSSNFPLICCSVLLQ